MWIQSKPSTDRSLVKPALEVTATGYISPRIHNDSAAVNHVRRGEVLDPKALHLPRLNSKLENLLAIVSLSCFFGLFYALPLTLLSAIVYALVYKHATATAVVALLLLDGALPAGQTWPAFRDWKLWDVWRRYFRVCVVLPEPPFLDKTKTFLLAQFPHASFPMAAFLTPALAGEPITGVPGPLAGVIASVLLQIPIFKHVFAWSACYPASQQILLELLKRVPVGMIPEGVAGIFEGANVKQERIYLKSRKGFVRVAIMAGADIVPVYHFGNSQLLRYAGSEFLSRKLRTTVGLFWARYGLAPHPHRLITALGHPLKVVQRDNPSPQEVDQTHAEFMEAIRNLYYQHRHLCGWEDRDLEIR